MCEGFIKEAAFIIASSAYVYIHSVYEEPGLKEKILFYMLFFSFFLSQKRQKPLDFRCMFGSGPSFISARLCGPETTCSTISMRGNKSAKVITSKLFARSSELSPRKPLQTPS